MGTLYLISITTSGDCTFNTESLLFSSEQDAVSMYRTKISLYLDLFISKWMCNKEDKNYIVWLYDLYWEPGINEFESETSWTLMFSFFDGNFTFRNDHSVSWDPMQCYLQIEEIEVI